MKLQDIAQQDVAAWIEKIDTFLFNERDMQMQLSVFLRGSGHYDDVDLEYSLPNAAFTDYPWDSELRLDIVVRKGNEYLPIELKYKTKAVTRRIERFGEMLDVDFQVVKNHGAQDLGKYDFWKDVKRLEVVRRKFKNVVGGVAVFMTNDAAYTRTGRAGSNHVRFDMVEGKTPKAKHWLREAAITRNYPDFEVDREYEIHWSSIRIEDEIFYYTMIGL